MEKCREVHCLWTRWDRQHSQLLLWSATVLLVLDQCQCHRSDSATLRWAGIVQAPDAAHSQRLHSSPEILLMVAQKSLLSFKSGQLGMSAAKVTFVKPFFSPLIIVFEPRLPAPKAQISREVLMLGVFLTHPLVSQCTLSPLPAPSGEGQLPG